MQNLHVPDVVYVQRLLQAHDEPLGDPGTERSSIKKEPRCALVFAQHSFIKPFSLPSSSTTLCRRDGLPVADNAGHHRWPSRAPCPSSEPVCPRLFLSLVLGLPTIPFNPYHRNWSTTAKKSVFCFPSALTLPLVGLVTKILVLN